MKRGRRRDQDRIGLDVGEGLFEILEARGLLATDRARLPQPLGVDIHVCHGLRAGVIPHVLRPMTPSNPQTHLEDSDHGYSPSAPARACSSAHRFMYSGTATPNAFSKAGATSHT